MEGPAFTGGSSSASAVGGREGPIGVGGRDGPISVKFDGIAGPMTFLLILLEEPAVGPAGDREGPIDNGPIMTGPTILLRLSFDLAASSSLVA